MQKRTYGEIELDCVPRDTPISAEGGLPDAIGENSLNQLDS
jgi:hypothetical protein